MEFLEPHQYQDNVNEIFKELQGIIKSIIPNAQIEHIGSSSIDGVVSKGDLDILVAVESKQFNQALSSLREFGLKIKEDTLRTNELCMFECFDYDIDVAVQLVDNSSEYMDFVVFRNFLKNNTQCLNQYNDLKRQSVGLDPNGYREKKSKFIEKVLAEARTLTEFETERLFLRGVKLSDSPSYQKNFADYEVIQHLSHLVPWPYPENGVHDFLKEMVLPTQGINRWTWAIFHKENKSEVIGVVDLWRKGCPENRGFWLAKKHWSKGYMTEAVTPVMDYAFNFLGFEKLVFANAVGNNRSRRVKEKTGAKFIETRPAKFVDPKYTEHEIWELEKSDWNSKLGIH